MKIQIKELGPIKEGEIDLSKKINVFCGQNSTGKTYLAFIIYALTKERISRNPLKIDLALLIENGETDIQIDTKALYKYKIETIKEIKSNLDSIFGISEEISKEIFKDFELKLLLSEEECVVQNKQLEFNDKLSFGDHHFLIEKK